MPCIEDELHRAVEETASSGVDWCVTLESKRSPTKWIQLTWEQINLHYPLDDDPSTTLGQIGWPDPDLELASWQAGSFVTFLHKADESLPRVAEFVRRYMEVILDENCLAEAWKASEMAV